MLRAPGLFVVVLCAARALCCEPLASLWSCFVPLALCVASPWPLCGRALCRSLFVPRAHLLVLLLHPFPGPIRPRCTQSRHSTAAGIQYFLGAGATATSLIEASTFLLQHLGGFWVEPLAGVRGVNAACLVGDDVAAYAAPSPPRTRSL